MWEDTAQSGQHLFPGQVGLSYVRRQAEHEPENEQASSVSLGFLLRTSLVVNEFFDGSWCYVEY